MFLFFILNKLTSTDRVERNFSYLIFLITLNTFLYCVYNFPIGHLYTTISSILNVFLIYIVYKFENIKKISEICRSLVFINLMVAGLTFFNGANYILHLRYSSDPVDFLWDEMLINWDTYLFGNYWKLGQLSLHLDTDINYGINTDIGHIYVEILQTFYMSYFIFGNFLAMYLAYTYFKQFFRNNKLKQRLIYRIILMFCTSWCSGFLITYILNFIFPAVSPRIYLQSYYKNEINGFFITTWFRQKISEAATNSYGAFPSAHCGVSWIIPIIAHRLNMPNYRNVTFFAATMISLATIVLRYHYFVDFLAGFVVTLLSVYFGGFHTQKNFEHNIEIKTLDFDNFDFEYFYLEGENKV